MKEPVLTIWQPWPDLILAGVKPVENRGWPVPATAWGACRECGGQSRHVVGCLSPDLGQDGGGGPFRLWIHAAKTIDGSNDRGQWHEWTNVRPAEDPRTGVLLGSVTVTGCHHADDCRVRDDCGVPGCTVQGHEPEPGREYAYCSRWAEPDVWHWTLADPVPLPEPIPLRGRQRLWRMPDEVARKVAA